MRQLCWLLAISLSLYPASTLLVRVGMQRSLSLPGIIAHNQNSTCDMQRRLHSNNGNGDNNAPIKVSHSKTNAQPTVAEFIKNLRQEFAKIDQSLLAQLHYKKSDKSDLNNASSIIEKI